MIWQYNLSYTYKIFKPIERYFHECFSFSHILVQFLKDSIYNWMLPMLQIFLTLFFFFSIERNEQSLWKLWRERTLSESIIIRRSENIWNRLLSYSFDILIMLHSVHITDGWLWWVYQVALFCDSRSKSRNSCVCSHFISFLRIEISRRTIIFQFFFV